MRLHQLVDAFRALGVQREMRARDTWNRERLERFQRERLLALVRHAVERSPFYADLYRGRDLGEDLQLGDLPVLTKTAMMAEYDRFVTDRRLRVSEMLSHLERISGDELFLGEYRVLATGGSSGTRGLFAFGRREWATALASVLRWGDFLGVKPRLLPRRMRVCSIGGDNPMHGTYRAAATLDVGLHKVLRLQATAPISELVAALDDFQPDAINAYPSVAALLASEQIGGRLSIRPRAVSTSSEVRTPEMERRMREAWGISPFNYYGMTEVMSFGVECAEHRGIHAFEDLFIFEVVDAAYQPVPPGTHGERVLLTNLHNFTQPLIRYELTDMIAVSPEPCPCGRPTRLVTSIEGRSDDVIYLQGTRGEVPVSFVHFFTAIETVREVREFQVVHETDGLHLRLVLSDGADRAAVARRIQDDLGARLSKLGASGTAILPEFLDGLPRDPRRMGKFKVIQSNVPRPGPR